MKVFILAKEQADIDRVSQVLEVQGHTPQPFSDWDECVSALRKEMHSILPLVLY